MPSISSFYGITIYMYPDDHNPPHFHALCNGKSAIVDINSARARGKLPKKEKKFVEVWAEIHRQELLDNWDLMMRENRVNNIAPLR
ncbi:MAG: DUF4160 domain-containing protein [Treponema sp.]|nr:DUF4160 domain-containing protein [Treponema sp.]